MTALHIKASSIVHSTCLGITLCALPSLILAPSEFEFELEFRNSLHTPSGAFRTSSHWG